MNRHGFCLNGHAQANLNVILMSNTAITVQRAKKKKVGPLSLAKNIFLVTLGLVGLLLVSIVMLFKL